MCLKRLFPQREVLRFQYSILPNKLQNFLYFILVACLNNTLRIILLHLSAAHPQPQRVLGWSLDFPH